MMDTEATSDGQTMAWLCGRCGFRQDGYFSAQIMRDDMVEHERGHFEAIKLERAERREEWERLRASGLLSPEHGEYGFPEGA